MESGLSAPYILKCTVSQTDLRSEKELEHRRLEDEARLRRTESARAAARDLTTEKDEFAAQSGLHHFVQTYSESKGRFLFKEKEIGGTMQETTFVFDGRWSLQVSHYNHRCELFEGLECNSLPRLYLPGVSMGMFPFMKYHDGKSELATALPGHFITDLFAYVPAEPHLPVHEIATTPAPHAADIWRYSDFRQVGNRTLAGTTRLIHFESGRKLIEREYRIESVARKPLDDSAYCLSTYFRPGGAVLFRQKSGRMLRFPYDPNLTLEQMTNGTPKLKPVGSLAERAISPYTLCGLGVIFAVGAYLLIKRSPR